MNNQNQLQELLKQHPLGMGVVKPINDGQKKAPSVNKQPYKRKRKSKLKLGIIKG